LSLQINIPQVYQQFPCCAEEDYQPRPDNPNQSTMWGLSVTGKAMKRSIFPELSVIVLLAFLAFIGTMNRPTEAQTDTSTPAATEIATDTATEIATEAIPRVLIQVASATANFRIGPGRVYRAITWVRRGNKILLSGISEDHGWYMFKYANKDTWISADSA